MSDFYKRLESGSTTGNLIDRNSVKEIVGSSVDLDDSTELVAAGYVKMEIVEKPGQPDNLKKEYVAGDDTEVSTGLWKNNWTLADKTLSADELTAINAVGMQNLRIERNYRLQLTDKFANSDLTMADDMRTYRQALRDLPAGVSDPFDFDWPANPAGTKENHKPGE